MYFVSAKMEDGISYPAGIYRKNEALKVAREYRGRGIKATVSIGNQDYDIDTGEPIAIPNYR